MEIKYRTITIDSTRADAAKRTVEASLSSEAPVNGEVLVHTTEAVNLTRSPSLNLLWNHDTNIVLGAVESIRIEGGKLRCLLRFGSSQRAQEVWQDVKDGILRNVSIGYLIDETEPSANGYLVTRWTLLEASLVAVPADASVGVGRSFTNTKKSGVFKMEKEQDFERTEQPNRAERRSEMNAERFRCTEINSIAERHPKLREIANQALQDGWPLEKFRQAALEKISNAVPISSSMAELDLAEIGMNEREIGKYSIVRGLVAQMNKDWSQAGLEREASRAIEKKLGRAPQGIFIPQDVLSKRALTVGTGSSGGYTVSTDLLAGSFIEILRNRTQVINMGATVMSGLKGNIAIPRQAGAGTAYWVGEGSDITLSEQTFDQVTMSPKTLGGRTQYTRKLLLQGTPDIENLVRKDLASILAVELDRVAINGSGSGSEPKGILKTSSIGDVAGGTNGAAPTWANIVNLPGLVEIANADMGALGFLTNAKVKKKLMTTDKTSGGYGQFVWESAADGSGRLAGYKALVSNNVPSTLTKGSASSICSAIIFGDWDDLIIGQWSGLDILLDPYTLAASGGMQVCAFMDVDIAVRQAAAFAAMQDALTT